MRRPSRPSGGLWSHADFLRLWTGQSISELGSQVSQLAIPWLAGASLHASAFEFSLLGVLGFLPFILFALPAGVWVDRLRRRPILVVGDAGRAVLLALVPVLWATHTLRMWHLLAIQFAVGVLTVIFDVAYQSYLPSLVPPERLVEGNAKLQSTAAAAGVGGPGLSGVLIGVLSAPYAVALDVASFVVSAVFVLRIRGRELLPERELGAPKPRLLPELKEGFAWVVRHRHLKWIAVSTGWSNFFSNVVFAIGLLYMQRVLHVSSFWAGAVFGGFGIGSVVGALTTTRLQRAIGIGNAIWLPTFLGSVGSLAFPLAPRAFAVPVLLAGTLLSGFGVMAYNITQVSYRQAITPERLQGRMNATMRWIVWGTIPLGALLGGGIATWTSLRETVWIGTLGGFFSFLPVLLSSVRTIEEIPGAAPLEPLAPVAVAPLAGDA